MPLLNVAAAATAVAANDDASRITCAIDLKIEAAVDADSGSGLLWHCCWVSCKYYC